MRRVDPCSVMVVAGLGLAVVCALATGVRSAAAADGGYVLTAEEKGRDCRKLTGRVTLRLMQLRSEPTRGGGVGAAVSDAIQGMAKPTTSLFWGKSSTYLSDRGAHLARDRAQLDAYNGLLAQKGCATFDIPAELAKGLDAPPPRPVKKKAVKAP